MEINLGVKIKKEIIAKKSKAQFINNFEFIVMCVPAVVLLIVFNYLPMIGLVTAFKDFRANLGIFGSEWVGLKNFDYFFTSQDAFRITRNTLGYNLVFIITGVLTAVIIALLLYEVKNRISLKFYQTSMILPHFLSWVIVGYITYILLNPTYGVSNRFLAFLGVPPIQWYSEPKYWPFILPVVQIWKGVGMSSIIYYATLMGVDQQIYEAAEIDGASRFKQVLHISVPSLIPVIIILTILALGNVFRGDFGLFYQIPRDVGILYPAVDVIDTYVYRGIRTGDYGVHSAVGLFQSVVGFITVVVTNFIVNKMSPENAMF